MIFKFLLVSFCIVHLSSSRHRSSSNRLASYRNERRNSLSSLASSFSSSDASIPTWSGGQFEWPCETTKLLYKNGGNFNKKNIIATRGAMYKEHAYLALPRFKSGVPATLARVSTHPKDGSSKLEPFPCWALQEEGNCNALQSVIDVFLDPYNILWVLDTGIVNSLESPVRTCSPKVVAINLETGKMVKTVQLKSLADDISRLQYVIADYGQDGRVFIYVTDAANNAILVYDVSFGGGYRVTLPDDMAFGGQKRDILYPVLLRLPDATTALVFSYFGSSRMFSIPCSYLQSGCANGKIEDRGKKPGKMIIIGTDNGSAMFFRYEGKTEIYRWDALTSFCSENFQKVSNGDEYGCSLAMHVFPDYEINGMRILEANFPDFIKGTVGCGVDHSLSVM